jgi:hypothetical protein
VWPLNRASGSEVIRLGRLAIERWVDRGNGLALVSTLPLPGDGSAHLDSLGQALSALYTDKPQGTVSVVLESAWAPLLLADTGGVLWGDGPVTALVRHRLDALYGSATDDVATWEVRVDHRAGDRFALGYGMSSRVKQALVSAAEQAGLKLDSLTPAFTWGWQRLRSAQQWPGRGGWWAWPEQDRMLVARVEAGRLVALNAAAPRGDSSQLIESVVDTEGVRWGLDAWQERVHAAAWLSPAQLPAPTERVAWHAVGGGGLVESASPGTMASKKVSA